MHTATLSDILEAYIQDKMTEQNDNMTLPSIRCNASDYVDFDNVYVPVYS